MVSFWLLLTGFLLSGLAGAGAAALAGWLASLVGCTFTSLWPVLGRMDFPFCPVYRTLLNACLIATVRSDGRSGAGTLLIAHIRFDLLLSPLAARFGGAVFGPPSHALPVPSSPPLFGA